MSRKPRVVIAGGTGFVGRRLAARLRERFEVVVLSRREDNRKRDDGVTIRKCDLFSLLDVEQALAGADYAVYLVHSMVPTSRLTQANFADLDLVVADNFARACGDAGVKQIVYLGGLLPGGDAVSRHLRSRREVEVILAARDVPVTTIRAGLIVGAGGSSFEMLMRLVRRLPVMICPKWTHTISQPVALSDVLDTLENALKNRKLYGRVLNVGALPLLSYQDMMKRTARLLGRKLYVFTVPLNSYFLSRLWVRLFSGAPASLVAPLVESMKHPMIAEPNHLGDSGHSFDDAVREALREERERAAGPGAKGGAGGRASERRAEPRPPVPEQEKKVRSIQRMSLPPGKTAAWAIIRYGLWLDGALGFLMRVQFVRREGVLRFRALGLTLLELTLSPERSSHERRLYYITGGVLLSRNPGRGRLEFRSFPQGNVLLTAIHDFRPRLWWFVYILSQAPVHLMVMRAFARHLEKYARKRLERAAKHGGDSSNSRRPASLR